LQALKDSNNAAEKDSVTASTVTVDSGAACETGGDGDNERGAELVKVSGEEGLQDTEGDLGRWNLLCKAPCREEHTHFQQVAYTL
jgi:hypothetical protein